MGNDEDYLREIAERMEAIEGFLHIWPEIDKYLRRMYQSKLRREHLNTLAQLQSMFHMVDAVDKDILCKSLLAIDRIYGSEEEDDAFNIEHYLACIETARKHLAKNGLEPKGKKKTKAAFRRAQRERRTDD